jgi:NAD(P)H-dependent flavin oxidoreductase YrpB (nitropropane dioxygenase family)
MRLLKVGAKPFVSAVGVPPKSVIDRLHAAGILYMNIVGHPKHVHKAYKAGADIICAHGGEAEGHTGDIPTSVLVPACADVCKQYKSPLTGIIVVLVATGGVYDGQSFASALILGESNVKVGTRFVATSEAGGQEASKK